MKRVVVGVLFALFCLVGLSAVPVGAQEACVYTGGSATLRTPGRPFDVEASADGCWLFVTVQRGGEGTRAGVAVYRAVDGAYRLQHVTPVGGSPADLTLSSDGTLMAVAANSLVVLLDVGRMMRGQDKAVIREVAVGEGAGAINAAISRDKTLLFVALERRGQVLALDLPALLRPADGVDPVVGAIPVGQAPVGLAFSPDGARLYATAQIAPAGAGRMARCRAQTGRDIPEGLLNVIDISRVRANPKGALVAQHRAGCTPVRVAVRTNGDAVVTARGEDAVLSCPAAGLEGRDPKPVKTSVGDAPVGVAVRDDGPVWVANSARFVGGAGSLSMIAPSGETRTIPSGEFPREVAFLPGGRTIVATQFGSNALQFVAADEAPDAADQNGKK
jgi:DNA-binding beta-propeller fold protein YncE